MLFYSDSPEDSDDARAALLPGIAGIIGQFLERRRADRLGTELDVSRDEYLDMIGHEVRTPLTAIESCVDLMTDGSALGQEQSQLLTVVRRNAASMHVLIDKLLETAALRAGDVTVTRAAVNLTALCQAAAADARAAGMDVVVNAPTPVIVDGDTGFLRRMVDELLHTAGPGGRIGLNLQPEGPTAVVTVTHRRPQDPPAAPGAGVPGTALGITFIRAIVQVHGGDLALNDSTDSVATFTIRLPTDGRSH
jgi:signal transduction histidine kinase